MGVACAKRSILACAYIRTYIYKYVCKIYSTLIKERPFTGIQKQVDIF